jgi:hypothetical protein
MVLMWGLILFSFLIAAIALRIFGLMSRHPWHGAMGGFYGLMLFGLLFGGVIFFSGISLIIGIVARSRYRNSTLNSPHPAITLATWAITLHATLVASAVITYATIFLWLDSLGPA